MHSPAPAPFPVKTCDQQLTFLLLRVLLLRIALPPSFAAAWISSSCQEGREGFGAGQKGVSGSRRVTVLVKSSLGLRWRGITPPPPPTPPPQSPCGDVQKKRLAPLLLFHPLPLSPSRPPLALVFPGPQGSRQPRVNKVIPGVGQREANPPPQISRSSPQTPTSSELGASISHR